MTIFITQPSVSNEHTVIKDKIEKIAGKVRIEYRFQNGKIIYLNINDKKLSASKKKELKTYIDTLKNE